MYIGSYGEVSVDREKKTFQKVESYILFRSQLHFLRFVLNYLKINHQFLILMLDPEPLGLFVNGSSGIGYVLSR